jgi:hypothetical protein
MIKIRSQPMFDLPLEYALIAFENAQPTGKIVPELLDLAQRGIVRFVDIIFIHKEADGSTRTVELNDLDPESYAMFVPIGEHVSSLFTNGDLERAANMLPENSANRFTRSSIERFTREKERHRCVSS